MVSQNWRSSFTNGGTPGKTNNSNQLGNIFINEFLTSNDNLNKDEFNEFDDWIEIFNNNDFPINIGGMYITDNFNNPFKYQIPFTSSELTTIPAKKHIIFWADEQTEQGIFHLNFKLDKDGEEIALIQVIDNDTMFIDSLTYSGQTTNISFGRIPKQERIIGSLLIFQLRRTAIKILLILIMKINYRQHFHYLKIILIHLTQVLQ